MKTALHNLMERIDFALIARAVSFRASAFRGSGVYNERVEDTLARCRIAARELWRGRPVAIFGVTPRGRSVWIENYEPSRHPAGDHDMLYIVHYRCPNIDDVYALKLPAPADRVRASAVVGTLDENRGAVILESPDDLSKLSGPLLVKLYNELIKSRPVAAGETALPTVKKFESLTVARPRVFAEIARVAVPIELGAVDAAVEKVANEPEPAPMAPVSTRAAPVGAPETLPPTEPQNPTKGDAPMAKTATKRKSKFDEDSKIHLLVSENPKREKTAAHKRFELYRNGMLVSTFLDKGGTTADLAWDVKNKFIEVKKS